MRRLVGPTYTITVLCAGSSLPSPLYAEHARVFGLSPFAITAMFAVYVAAIIPTMVVYGGSSDSWGPGRVIRLGICLSALSSLIFASALGPGMLFAARGLQGVALGVSTAAVTVTLVDATSPRRLGALLTSMGISAGSASGPLLSGMIAHIAPAPLVAPYLAHVALLVPAYIMALALPEPPTRQPWRPPRPSIPRSIRRTFILASGTTVLAWSLLGFFLAVVPSLVGVLDRPGDTLLAGATVTLMLASATVAQFWSGRLPVGHHQALGLVAMGIGMGTLVGAAAAGSLAALWVAAVIIGVGEGIGFSGALADVAASAPNERRGEVVSLLYIVGYLALAVPILGVGMAANWLGLRPAVVWFGACEAVGCLAMLVVARRAGRAGQSGGDKVHRWPQTELISADRPGRALR
jgi:MFS family permease